MGYCIKHTFVSSRTYTQFQQIDCFVCFIRFSLFNRRCFANASEMEEGKRDLVSNFYHSIGVTAVRSSRAFWCETLAGTRVRSPVFSRSPWTRTDTHARRHSIVLSLVHCTTEEAGKAQCMYTYLCTAPNNDRGQLQYTWYAIFEYRCGAVTELTIERRCTDLRCTRISREEKRKRRNS